VTVIRKLGNLFIFTLFGTFLGTVVSVIVTQLYNSAARLFPKTFPLYNVVLESEKHAAQEQRLSFIALLFTVILVVYVTQRFNNERFEYLITKTDGLYYMKDAIPIYAKRFYISDIISSVIVGAAFSVPIYFIPMQFFAGGTAISTLLLPFKTLTNFLGVTVGSITLVLFFTVAHVITTPIALLYYRAKWLSGFAEG
jgi:hypothetical protein